MKIVESNIKNMNKHLASNLENVTNFMKENIYLVGLLIIILIAYIFTSCNNNLVQLVGGEQPQLKVITLYYVKWCPHCKTVLPEWDKLEKDNELKNKVIVKKINCETKEGEKIAEEKEIEGFPTILVNNNNKEISYEGGRSYGEMKEFIMNN